MSYTNDLSGYIENMKDIEKSAGIKGEAGLLMMASFARKTAEEFKSKGKKLESENAEK